MQQDAETGAPGVVTAIPNDDGFLPPLLVVIVLVVLVDEELIQDQNALDIAGTDPPEDSLLRPLPLGDDPPICGWTFELQKPL